MIDRKDNKSHPTTNFHVDYVDVTQHWSAISEPYAGGDGLVTALTRGWEIIGNIRREEKWYAGMRHIVLYYVTLERNGTEMVMPVLNNPYVNRLMQNAGVEILPNNNKEQ